MLQTKKANSVLQSESHYILSRPVQCAVVEVFGETGGTILGSWSHEFSDLARRIMRGVRIDRWLNIVQQHITVNVFR